MYYIAVTVDWRGILPAGELVAGSKSSISGVSPAAYVKSSDDVAVVPPTATATSAVPSAPSGVIHEMEVELCDTMVHSTSPTVTTVESSKPEPVSSSRVPP